ncbi:DUF5610 domain-containing protein [bacterium]|nr:DUF5610 domain-containing protein [bacterium]
MDGVSLTAAYERQAFSLSANYQLQSEQLLLTGQPAGEGRGSGDVLAIGSSETLNLSVSLEIVVERAYARLQGRLGAEGVPTGDLPARPDLGDYSPEAVADRIVGFATGFLGAYLENHADEPQDEAVSAFQQLIRDAIEEGFRQARDILNSLSALSPEIGGVIDETFQLTMQKLDEFFARLRGEGSGGDVVQLSGGPLAQLEYYEDRTSISLSLTYTRQSQLVEVAAPGQSVDVTT